MAYLASMHARLVITITLFFAALALWSLIVAWRRAALSTPYRAALWIGQLLVLAEAAIGLPLLFVSGSAPILGMHLLYGAIAVVTLPAAALYLRGRPPRAAALTYALVSVFLCGIALRALETGRV